MLAPPLDRHRPPPARPRPQPLLPAPAPPRHAGWMATWISIIFASLLALASLAACKPRDNGAAAHGGGSAAATPHRGGTLVVGWTSEPMGVNELLFPTNTNTDEVLRHVFLHLVEEQPDYERHPPTIGPLLATSYDWSPDHKLLSFHLREAQWSDGAPLTAEDVRWSWQMARHPQIGWPSAYELKPITDVEVVDPHTARFHFSRVYSKQLLDANDMPILPKHAWERVPPERWRESGDWFKQHVVASGPYTLESWTPQQEIVLRRNERYWRRDRPLIDRVVFRTVPDQNSLLTQVQSGEIDFLPAFSPRDAPKVLANPRLRLIRTWFRSWVAMVWNTARPLFSDPAARRALTLAIDRQSLVDTLWGPYARIADSPIPHNVWAHDPGLRPWPYQPEEARRILAARGWKPGPGGVLQRGGQPFAFEIVTNAGNQQRVDAATIIQAELRRVGVRVEVRQIDFNTLSGQLDKGRFDATIMGWGIDTGLDLTAQFSSQSFDSGNLTHYSNPEVDRLIEHSLAQPEMAQALPDLMEIQRIVHRDLPYTFLWESQRLIACNRRLHDVRSNALRSFFRLEDWWMDPAPR